MLNKLKTYILKLNRTGIPLPMIQVDGKSSFTATLTFISFNTALIGQVGKISHFLGEVDLTQANYLFLISLGAFLGHRVVTGNASIDSAIDPAIEASTNNTINVNSIKE